MELCSVLCGSLDGSGVWEEMDTCICVADCLPVHLKLSQHFLLIGYTWIQTKKKKKHRAVFRKEIVNVETFWWLHYWHPKSWALVEDPVYRSSLIWNCPSLPPRAPARQAMVVPEDSMFLSVSGPWLLLSLWWRFSWPQPHSATVTRGTLKRARTLDGWFTTVFPEPRTVPGA